MLFGIAVGFAPILVVAIGVFVIVGLSCLPLRPGDRLAPVVAAGFIALGFGLTLRLASSDALRPVHLDLFGATTSADLTVPLAITLIGTLVSPLLALGTLARRGNGTFQTIVGLLLSTLLTLGFFLDNAASAIVPLWTLLLLLGAALQVWPSLDSSDSLAQVRSVAEPWLTLVVVGAPLLWLATSSGAGSPSVLARALLLLIGAATAGLPPLGAQLSSRSSGAPVVLVADGLLPLIGFTLAATGLLTGGPTSPALSALALLLALASVAVLGRRLATGQDIRATLLSNRQVDLTLSFLALATGMPLAAAVGMAIVAIGTLARGAVRADAGRWSGWLAPLTAASPPAETRIVSTTRRSLVGDLWLMLQLSSLRVSRFYQNVEERFDLALGLLIVITTLFAFAT